MKKIIFLLLLLTCLILLPGCSGVMQQMETVSQQLDVEAVIADMIEQIDWEELKNEAQTGYDALLEQFPALRSENIKNFLKEHGLELLRSYVESTDPQTLENARKLGQIIKILNPELQDEVNAVIG